MVRGFMRRSGREGVAVLVLVSGRGWTLGRWFCVKHRVGTLQLLSVYVDLCSHAFQLRTEHENHAEISRVQSSCTKCERVL